MNETEDAPLNENGHPHQHETIEGESECCKATITRKWRYGGTLQIDYCDKCEKSLGKVGINR